MTTDRIESILANVDNQAAGRSHGCLSMEDERLLAERVRALTSQLALAQEWAQQIASDERVNSWVHQYDYGLYCLLADCPVDFDAQPQPVPNQHPALLTEIEIARMCGGRK